ncbi:branched-chain amino acid transport system permease protein [Paenibacillus forsythiae]|uniref:Branched-chain amino acid transport system permease protein n=1 Tax=Paenibacillus forsythiae TaxID=365616 RepID=A0ABU3H5X3_9BACL|nr:branched-chain amino acid ABC transporter permease [Paenibacillus forsythiae]MDT3426221.1 branched-chain amino acid transport system permease protein [Paenibacillus forsythiae]
MNRILACLARNQLLISLTVLALALLFPLVFPSQYSIRMATLCGMYIVLALSLNLITGYTGQVSLGHAAFFGIGAYTAAILATRFGLNFLFTFIAAAIVAGLAAFLLGLPTLKLKGHYLAMVTLGFCEIVRLVEMNWMGLTRGPLGILNIPPPSLWGFTIDAPIEYYYFIVALVVLTIKLVQNIVDSRVGKGLIAISEDEIAAEAMGINILRYKVMVFVISAALAGFAGAFYAQYMSYIDPTSFGTDQSISIFIMIIFGGLASIPGTIIGVIVLTLLPEVLRGLMDFRLIIYGLILIAMMLVKPEGLLGNINFTRIKKAADGKKAGELK